MSLSSTVSWGIRVGEIFPWETVYPVPPPQKEEDVPWYVFALPQKQELNLRKWNSFCIPSADPAPVNLNQITHQLEQWILKTLASLSH